MIALVPVRDGVIPAGAPETIAECGGRVLVAGSGTDDADLEGLAVEAHLVELGDYEAARWTQVLASIIEGLDRAEVVVCPHSPDGRDLAPRLALALDRPLLAGATAVAPHRVRLARRGGHELHERRPQGPFVATMQPGARGPVAVDLPLVRHRVGPAAPATTHGAGPDADLDARVVDARVVEVLPPDVSTMDLSEAARIVGGGAGLDSAERFAALDRFAAAIGGVMGATRVITDRGWVHHDRQIGTTGVVVDPVLYLAFGISGAVQHTSGLGQPQHIVSVNIDPHCPMMAMSDLAIVSDANDTLDALVELVGPGVDPAVEPAR